jgi:hypothetical protein
MTRTEVAILGGGLAGLNAARVLHQAGIAVQLFEARDRLGGRILTVGETCTPDSGGFDLGPSWFWPRMQPELATLVTELGIRSFGQHSAGDLLFERSLREPPQRANGAGQDQGSMRLASGTGALVQALAKDLPVECLHLTAPGAQPGSWPRPVPMAAFSACCACHTTHHQAALPPFAFTDSRADLILNLRRQGRATPGGGRASGKGLHGLSRKTAGHSLRSRINFGYYRSLWRPMPSGRH